MSAISTTDLSLSSLGADAGISSFNTADVPENVRDGDSSAREAYVEGLAFEDVLVKQMAQQMVQTSDSAAALDGSDSSDGSDGDSGDSTSSSSGLFGASDDAYSSLIPQTLANSIMSGGGLGIADEIAESIDPAMKDATASGATTATASGADGGAGLITGTDSSTSSSDKEA